MGLAGGLTEVEMAWQPCTNDLVVVSVVRVKQLILVPEARI